MIRYSFEAINTNNKRFMGVIEAMDMEEARTYMRQKGLMVITLEALNTQNTALTNTNIYTFSGYIKLNSNDREPITGTIEAHNDATAYDILTNNYDIELAKLAYNTRIIDLSLYKKESINTDIIPAKEYHKGAYNALQTRVIPLLNTYENSLDDRSSRHIESMIGDLERLQTSTAYGRVEQVYKDLLAYISGYEIYNNSVSLQDKTTMHNAFSTLSTELLKELTISYKLEKQGVHYLSDIYNMLINTVFIKKVLCFIMACIITFGIIGIVFYMLLT